MIRQLLMTLLTVVVLVMATAVNGESPSFLSKLRPGAGQNLLPKAWPSSVEMRKGYENASFFDFTRDAVREYAVFFNNLVAREYAEDGVTSKDLEYLWFDLNSDGQDEVIVRVDHLAFCGSVGCSGNVFERIDNVWKEIGGGAIMEVVKIGPPIRNRYQTLWFGDMCVVWNVEDEKYDLADDDRQDGDQVHSHACGKNYDPNTADATFACSDCHN